LPKASEDKDSQEEEKMQLSIQKAMRKKLFENQQDRKDQNYDSANENDRAFFRAGETVLPIQELQLRKKDHFLKNKIFGIKLNNLVANIHQKKKDEHLEKRLLLKQQMQEERRAR